MAPINKPYRPFYQSERIYNSIVWQPDNIHNNIETSVQELLLSDKGKLILVVTRIRDINGDRKQSLFIPTHNIYGDNDIQSKLRHLTSKSISIIQVYSQVTKGNGY